MLITKKMIKEHKTRCLELSKSMPAECGGSSSALQHVKLVNSDFSAIIQVAGNISPKNNIIWAETDLKDKQD